MSSAEKAIQTAVVHVVDDDDSLRNAVVRLLRIAGYEVRSYASVGEFLLARPGQLPGCVVLDIRMPGPNGFELQDSFARHGESLPIIFLTGHGDIRMSVRAMRMGAVDFLTKPVESQELLRAVQMALARDAETRAARERLREYRQLFEALTPREQEVFAQVVAGKLNKQSATELGISERTIKAHRAQMMEKMHAASLAELMHIAEQLRAPDSRPAGLHPSA